MYFLIIRNIYKKHFFAKIKIDNRKWKLNCNQNNQWRETSNTAVQSPSVHISQINFECTIEKGNKYIDQERPTQIYAYCVLYTLGEM